MNTNKQKYLVKKDFSLKKEILKYFVHWQWFILSLFLCVAIAVVFLKITNPIFNNKTTILIREAEESRGFSELAAFKDFDILEGANDKNDEIELIKSESLIYRVVDSLDLYVQQNAKIGFRDTDIYDISPLEIKFVWKAIGYREKRKAMKDLLISIDSENQYQLEYEEENVKGVFNFQEPVVFEQGVLLVNKSAFFKANTNLKKHKKIQPIEEIKINIYPKNYFTSELSKAIVVAPKSKSSNVLEISLKHANGKKANDVLDNLVYQYNKDAMEDKGLVARNTDVFINERIRIISKELDSVESNKVLFKKTNELTDIKSESEVFVKEISDSKKRLLDIETQLDLTDAMIKYLKSNSRSSDLLPANIGIDNISIHNAITDFNKLVLERNRLLSENATEFNPFVVSLNNDIASQRQNLVESLKNQKLSLQITRKDFNKEKAKINTKIRSIPKIEKDYLDIERQQNIKQNLYLFLLKKREENSISMAVASPVAKIIDKSITSNKPIFPKAIVLLAIALVFGLGIPFAIIYMKELLDTKVNTRLDIRNILNDVPVLGEVIALKKNQKATIGLNDRSALGESFRIMRTNFNYFAKSRKREGKALRVFVTSTIKGEGKTFVSFNTMLSLADSNKKVVVIGGDIRNPKLNKYIETATFEVGLTNYLYDSSLKAKEIIKSINFEGRAISYIPSGRIPPNPSELLMNGRLKGLLAELESSYDIIIIDTAPTMLVTDTLLMTDSADVTIYVVRSGYTEKETLLHVREIQKEGKISNMAIVLNGVKQNKSGYGYGYGYNAQKKKKFFSKA